MIYHLELPLTKEALLPLGIRDVCSLSGDLYTARDAAHRRLAEGFSLGLAPPFDLRQAIIFYAGPCPPKPGQVSGSIGPTTSLRMDAYVESMLQQGISAMIGKGDRSPFVAELCREYGAVYFLGIGGAAALLASQVQQVELIAYEDLGTEAIRRLKVREMKVIVGIDTKGRELTAEEIPKYRR